MTYQFDTILTLDARSHLFLEATSQHLQLSDQHVFNMIQQLFLGMKETLKNKHIDYQDLRGVLVPRTARNERALVFDYTKFADSMYGREVMYTLLPLLRKDSSHSILCGDWLHGGDFKKWLAISPAAQGTVDPARAPVPYQTLYFVYLNNLSNADAARIHQAFTQHPAYLGSLDLNFGTPMKGYLSTCLVRDCIKHRGFVIRGHEDDRDADEDHNLSLIDFSRFGLMVRSLPLTLYGVFLSYKIERPALPRELDQRFALNAMSPAPVPIDGFEVAIDGPKLDYLRTNKLGSLRRAGFEGLSAQEVSDQIRAKIGASYIYELSRATAADTLKFNVSVEATTGARTMCVLEYRPQDRALKVLTFY